MFEKFGDQVWYFNSTWDISDGLVEFYKKLKQIVRLMPNLKYVHICQNYVPSKEELLPLEEEIQRNPFPKRAKLEMISVYGIPGVLCGHLVNQNRQISRLEGYDVIFGETYPLFTEKLPNLNQLSLEASDLLQILEAFERYPAILNLKGLKITGLGYGSFVPWSRLFNAVGSKVNSDTCMDLQLGMPEPDSDAEIMSVFQDSLECRLKLANIQRCKIHSSARFSLDFLLPSKNSLREIDIERSYLHSLEDCANPELRETEEEIIKFVGYEDKMEESNIAKQLPALRKLTVYEWVWTWP